jgi:Phage Mu protein F like protein
LAQPQALDPSLLEQADPLVKIWHVVGDSRTRESHFAADGQIAFADEAFVVGDALLDEPRDPDGPPDETYNCRCRVEYVRFSQLSAFEKAQLDPNRVREIDELVRMVSVGETHLIPGYDEAYDNTVRENDKVGESCGTLFSLFLNLRNERKNKFDTFLEANAELEDLVRDTSQSLTDDAKGLLKEIGYLIRDLYEPDPREITNPNWASYSNSRIGKFARRLSRGISIFSVLTLGADLYDDYVTNQLEAEAIIRNMAGYLDQVSSVDAEILQIAKRRQELGCPPIPSVILNNPQD